jgi:hypothetical protein
MNQKATEAPDGGNLLVRLWRGAGTGNLPAYSTTPFFAPTLGECAPWHSPAAPSSGHAWPGVFTRTLAPGVPHPPERTGEGRGQRSVAAAGAGHAPQDGVNSVRLNFCMVAELSDATGRYGRSTLFHWSTR